MVRILEEMRLNVVSKETNFTGRRSKKTSKLIDDDDEHTLCDPGINKKGLCHNFEDEEDVREESNDQTHHPSSTKIRNSFISNRDEKLSMSQLRKRRRSSARFLRMSGRFTLDHEDGDTVESDKTEEKNEHLGEMYRQVIRMNAENKINASNSWGLKLIENIDKFLEDDVTTGTQTIENSTAIETSGSDGANHEASDLANLRENDKRINFTKASCTIDASVKIYSYRVDDVYLSSYKVLANLNRSDGNHTTETDIDNMGHDQESSQSISDEKLIGSAYSSQKKVKQNQVICTLEENLSNINVTKLDFAFDIDPLFHKMSQQFDEGGAKGLLLVNLGVASDGCRLVLDSKEDAVSDFDLGFLFDDDMVDIHSLSILDSSCVIDHDGQNQQQQDRDIVSPLPEGIIDVTKLRDKLQELILMAPLESIDLVPQLSELRSEQEHLKSLGFLDVPRTQTDLKRYANDVEDEKAAEIEIHQQALERSRISLNRTSDIDKNNLNNDSKTVDHDSDNGDGGFGLNDFDDDDYDNDINDLAATSLPLEHDQGAIQDLTKPSSLFISNMDHSYLSDFPTQSHDLLDAVCSGQLLPTQTPYSFFSASSLDKLISGNSWAGSVHWKSAKNIRVDNGVKAKRKKSTNKKDISTKGQKDEAADDKLKLQSESDKYILPVDACISVNHLSRYFLRQHDILLSRSGDRTQVDIDPDVAQVPDRDDHGFMFYGEDDSRDGESHDGPAYDFVDDNRDDANFFSADDFQVDELQNIRRVERVEVAHAVVSKKVDVKRLKSSLWSELDSKLSNLATVDDSFSTDESKTAEIKPVSFRDTVKDLSASQSQESVSFAFYFICVLHLANENSLVLDNSDYGLSDFFISRS